MIDETVPSADPPPTPPPTPSSAPGVSSGSRVGPYSVERELARGGQGAVLSARHTQLITRVAVKVLLDPSPNAVARFEREAKLLARLHHRNLPTVSDLGYSDGHPYLAMELIEGRDLKAAVAAGGVPQWAWTAEVLGAVADVLHYCHGHGVIHRDVKPANILLERVTGRAVLVDFGLAKPDAEQLGASLEERASALSKTDEVKGTPAFMAPEQASSEFGDVGPATDVYALGATLYFLLTGEPPFAGNSLFSLLHKVMEAPPPDPVAVNPEVPFPLADLCRRALAKSPAERPKTAAAFAAELRAAAAISEDRTPTTLGLVRRLYGRAVWVATLALVCGISLGAGWIVGRPTAAETRALELAAARTAQRDTWGLAQRMLIGGSLTSEELDELARQAAADDTPNRRAWIPFVRSRTKLSNGAGLAGVLTVLPLGPDRDLVELDHRIRDLDRLRSTDALLLRLARSAEKSTLPWAGDPIARWDRLATELAFRGRRSGAAGALSRSALLAAASGRSAAFVLQRLEHAAELDVIVVAQTCPELAALLLREAQGVLEREQLRASDAPAIAHARAQLVLYRLLKPSAALPASTLESLERLADRKVLPLREAVLPGSAWQLRLEFRKHHVASLKSGVLNDRLRRYMQGRGSQVIVHLQRYWLLHFPQATRSLWHDLAQTERILGRAHIAERAARVAVERCQGLRPRDRAYEERLLALVLRNRNDHEGVLRVLESQLQALPTGQNGYARLRAAYSLLHLERFQEAKTQLEHLAEAGFWRGERSFWWLRGDALHGEGLADPARRCWLEAERIPLPKLPR